VTQYLRRVLLGPEGQAVAGRKTYAKRVSRDAALTFHGAHHLQGVHPNRANVHFGLYHTDVLVALASFGSDGQLHRYTTGAAAVLGGLPKLLKASGFPRVVTFCDRDHFTGGIYEQAGFKYDGYTLQLTYLKGQHRGRREQYMKKNLSAIWPDADMTMTEKDICAAHNVYACYNSGIDRWVWER